MYAYKRDENERKKKDLAIRIQTWRTFLKHKRNESSRVPR